MQSQNITQQPQNLNPDTVSLSKKGGKKKQKSLDKQDLIIDLLQQLNHQLQNTTLNSPISSNIQQELSSDSPVTISNHSSDNLDHILLNIDKYNKLVQQLKKQKNNNDSQTYDLICQMNCHDQISF